MEFPLLLTVVLAVTVLLPSFVDSAIQCKDQNNQNVDWFIVYKLPKILNSQYPLVQAGLGHLYMDVNRLQLEFTYPDVYDYNFPDLFTKDNLNLNFVLKYDTHVTQAPFKKLLRFKSLAGQVFTSFAKNAAFHEDLYSAWLAPYYKSDMNVESWQKGRGTKLGSNCAGTFKVCNIRKVFLNTFTAKHGDFRACVPNASPPNTEISVFCTFCYIRVL
ncbi:hypothetical protein CAPTEDRAFT_201001 [Capitella teleta]|uniref:Uncharacterized protein n=1 Tax=Capitella teleta TaxID=283909 RepID=R7T876_CAPTE|nr:hypothetical protein CAPTEDRAFT_201001 [Capitella teleta]|eukprot:ELT87169.1 hypothetical protein CAPTEDRAFT_201001 [Capitella teleta]